MESYCADLSIALLDYLTPSNTIIVYRGAEYESFVNECRDHHFSCFSNNAEIPDSLGSYRCPVENVILLGCFPPNVSPSLNRVFTTEKREDCFLFNPDKFKEHAFCHRLPFDEQLPLPLRGIDGPETFTGITMTRRIPDIIRQVAASQPQSSPVVSEYHQLAHTIRDNGSLPGVPRTTDLLTELFRIQVSRAIHDHLHWHEISWWLAENYEFLLLNRIQRSDASLPSDPFHALKQQALSAASGQIESFFSPLIRCFWDSQLSQEAFSSVLLTLLWGNKADLSMSSGVVHDALLHSFLNTSSNSILVNHSQSVWNFLQTNDVHEITIFADNCGLEMLCDFLFITLLLTKWTHCTIHYIVKASPVFVSDVTLNDIQPGLDVLHQLQDPSMKWMSDTLEKALQTKRFDILPSVFLSSSLPGWEMPSSMLAFLRKQSLVITKGDANYRRLEGDLHWEYDTPLDSILKYFPCPLLMLRTLKSNVLMGVPKTLQDKARSADPNWDCSGKVGVIQFYCPLFLS